MIDAVKYIESTNRFGMKLGLETTGILLEKIGNPHRELKFIHIAGTNGKGSTASMISSILVESGYRTGLFTSPYLEVFNERIRINGENISDEDLQYCIEKVKAAVDTMVAEGHDQPTEFEIVTATAFLYYKIKQVDIVVLEVGLGGRFDATNIIDKSEISVITSISLDHTRILGDTLDKIAFEKAGIIKENGLVLSWPQKKEALEVIKKQCMKMNAQLIVADFENIEEISSKLDSQKYRVKDDSEKGYTCYEICLNGSHQIKNSYLAISTCRILSKKFKNITDSTIISGLKKAKWAGRIEKIMENPLFIIDGAHNADGAKALKDELEKILDEFKPKRKTLVIGMLEDKDVVSSVKMIIPYFDRIITTRPMSPRAMDADKLADIIENIIKDEKGQKSVRRISDSCGKKECNEEKTSCEVEIISENDEKKAVEKSFENTDFILSCGSLYLVGNVRSIVKNNIKETL